MTAVNSHFIDIQDLRNMAEPFSQPKTWAIFPASGSSVDLGYLKRHENSLPTSVAKQKSPLSAFI
jgi:hypothetical protein